MIRDKLANWEQFIHSSAHLDPLVVMSLAHYQFEAIHPFPDGNGRTGRILSILHLVDAGLLQQPILYLSRYVIRHRDDYYHLLLEVIANGAWTDWTLVMSRCRVSRPTATGWLNALVDAEVLLDMKVGRERIFVNTEFFALLVRDDDLDNTHTLTLF